MENMKFDSLRRAYIRRIILAVALLLAVILTVPTFMDLPSKVLSKNYKETAYAAEVYNSDDGRNVYDPDLGKALSKIKFCFVAGAAVLTLQLLKNGKISGFDGHHIFSVKDFPDLAGDPNNIKFLTKAEHLAAHSGNWANKTNGTMLDRMLEIAKVFIGG